MDASKNEVIHQYEVGLSKLFRKNNFRLGAYVDIDALNQHEPHVYINTNPLLVFWKTLLSKYSFPFLKRELLIKPHVSKAYWMYNLHVHIGGWKKLVEKYSDYPTRNILSFLSNYCAHLQRNNTGITLQKRKILFIAPAHPELCRFLVGFLIWLKAETDTDAEIVIASKENNFTKQTFAGLGRITSFHELQNPEKRNLKERLSDEVAVIFWSSMENTGLRSFLSFLDVPQIILLNEHISLIQNYLTADTRAWLHTNTIHFIVTSPPIRQLLMRELNIDQDKITTIHPFTVAHSPRPTETAISDLKIAAHIPADAFIAGLYADAEDEKTPALLPVIAQLICRPENNIHLLWMGRSLPNPIIEEILKAGLSGRVHIAEQTGGLSNWCPLLSLAIVASFNNHLPLLILDLAQAGKPVICFDEPGVSDEYMDAGIVQTVPYLDLAALAAKINSFYTGPEKLLEIQSALPAIVASNFSSDTQARSIYDTIKKYYDEDELMLAERPLITFLTHIYYENSWEEIKYKLKDFDNGENHFLFSISEACLVKDHIIADIKRSFENAHYLITSNIGKDIGGKMALIDIYLLLGFKSNFIVFLHDKQSPHSIIGESWKKGLFKIIDINNERAILSAFRDPQVGIVGDRNQIINEYDTVTGNFKNNSQISKRLLLQFDMNIENYDFLGGSMYWIRSSIIEHFFKKNHPIGTRENLEAGNVLDLHEERLAHSWERMFSWIATNEGYNIKGI
jgi:glycosyltransferase involved in cell wall biosynthesis